MTEDWKLTHDGAAAVSNICYWQPMATAPIGTKIQLLGIGGVASYGNYIRGDNFWCGWAPMPRKQPQGTP